MLKFLLTVVILEISLFILKGVLEQLFMCTFFLVAVVVLILQFDKKEDALQFRNFQLRQLAFPKSKHAMRTSLILDFCFLIPVFLPSLRLLLANEPADGLKSFQIAIAFFMGSFGAIGVIRSALRKTVRRWDFEN